MKPHKHAELIKAWADGAEIQCYNDLLDEWITVNPVIWHEPDEYRIKPEPKPDFVEYLHPFFHFGIKDWLWDSKEKPNLKLTFDGETGELKSAEVLK